MCALAPQVDPFALVKPELGHLADNVKAVLGSDHPVLSRVAKCDASRRSALPARLPASRHAHMGRAPGTFSSWTVARRSGQRWFCSWRMLCRRGARWVCPHSSAGWRKSRECKQSGAPTALLAHAHATPRHATPCHATPHSLA